MKLRPKPAIRKPKPTKRDIKCKLIRLIEKERIHFHGPDHHRPDHHSQLCDALDQLSRYNFDQYVHNFTHETHQKPWRARIKQQVCRVVSLAEDCSYARQNEFGWRLKLEHEILARLSTELTCKRCTSRLWQSEVEVLLESADTFGHQLRLEERHAGRKTCFCSEMQRSLDRNDPGICRIFHDRTDEPVKYLENDAISGVLPSEQRPDRVYGFRKTSRFSRLLDEANSIFEGHELQELRDILECGPFHELRDQLLFPFLVLEAKSSVGDSFDDIEIQTAFAIKKLLDIQIKLRSATGEKSQWQSGPLVWFLSNRGHDWRVAAAYVEMNDEKAHYHVHYLWTGSILSKDTALQLLLIIDYIVDWARDCHREAILNELRIVAGRNAASLANDTEIASLADHMQRFLDTDVQQRLMEALPDPQDPVPQGDAMSRWPDNEHCVFRSIHDITARVSALYITGENVAVLLRSSPSVIGARKMARDLLGILPEACKVAQDALEAIEFMWTSKQREDPDLYRGGLTFYAVFTVAAYFLHDWTQVLELTYIAIAENALNILKARAEMQETVHVDSTGIPYIPRRHLVEYLRYFRQSLPRSRLQAAMQRRCMSSRLVRRTDHPDDSLPAVQEPFGRSVHYRPRMSMLPDTKPTARYLVALVYHQCKRGMRNPEESFLRTSGIFENKAWGDRDMSAIWQLRDLPVPEAALYICLVSDKVVNNKVAKLCVCIMDDILGPQAFSVWSPSFGSCELFLIVETYVLNHNHNTVWNLSLRSGSPAMSQQLQTKFRAVIASLANRSAVEAVAEITDCTTYDATTQLHTHVRREVKIPQHHWVLTTCNPDSHTALRLSADHYPAKIHPGKHTPFQNPERNTVPATLTFKQHQDTKMTLEQPEDESHRRVDEVKELHKQELHSDLVEPEAVDIAQEGDESLRPPTSDLSLKRKRSKESFQKAMEYQEIRKQISVSGKLPTYQELARMLALLQEGISTALNAC